MTKTTNIYLKPKPIFWLISNLFTILLVASAILICNHYKDYHELIKYVGLLITLVGFLFLFYKYIDMLICTNWIITDEQLIIKKGVFIRTVNYIELYRIYDYEEKQTFIQSLFNITTLCIHSGDKSHPVLPMYGLKKDDTIISTIRGRVEKERLNKKIYEFTNR